jgi:hypothetical protein
MGLCFLFSSSPDLRHKSANQDLVENAITRRAGSLGRLWLYLGGDLFGAMAVFSVVDLRLSENAVSHTTKSPDKRRPDDSTAGTTSIEEPN